MCEKIAYVLLPVVNSYVNTSIRIISLSLARKPRGLTVIEFLLFIFFLRVKREKLTCLKKVETYRSFGRKLK